MINRDRRKASVDGIMKDLMGESNDTPTKSYQADSSIGATS